MTEPAKVKVFVSYSWQVELDTSIVDELEKLCPERNIELVRDKKTMQHGELIRDFMDQLAGGEHIITIFSDAYFKSTWCMYELLTTWQLGDFKDRTYPILIDGIDLQDDDYQIAITNFWVQKYTTAENKLSGLDPKLYLKQHEKVVLYRDISQNINGLINFAANRLTTPLDQLKAQQYTQILDFIHPKVIEIKRETDDQFLEDVKALLKRDLRKSDLFSDHILKNCGLTSPDADSLHDYLISECSNGQLVKIIQILQSAFAKSFNELKDSDNIGINNLYQAAENTLAKLVLFNVRGEWLMAYHGNQEKERDHAQVLPDLSSIGIEVLVSRNEQILPGFRYRPDTSDSFLVEKRIPIIQLKLESGYNEEKIIEDMIKQVFNHVMKTKISEDMSKDNMLRLLQHTMNQKKDHFDREFRKSYFIQLPASDSNLPLAVRVIQEKLMAQLPDLFYVRIRSGAYEEAFIIEDIVLMAAILEFYKTLEEYKTQ